MGDGGQYFGAAARFRLQLFDRFAGREVFASKAGEVRSVTISAEDAASTAEISGVETN